MSCRSFRAARRVNVNVCLGGGYCVRGHLEETVEKHRGYCGAVYGYGLWTWGGGGLLRKCGVCCAHMSF